MFKLSMSATLVAAAFFANTATAEHANFAPKAHDQFGKCVKAALAKHDGEIIKAEFKAEGKSGVYEFDMETADGKAWDIECDAKSAKITEIEEEVKADDARFTAMAKVSEADAKATALAKQAGTVKETEYELEPDGKASYEFDILADNGNEYKIEVDATTGKIVEANLEVYQIGKE